MGNNRHRWIKLKKAQLQRPQLRRKQRLTRYLMNRPVSPKMRKMILLLRLLKKKASRKLTKMKQVNRLSVLRRKKPCVGKSSSS